MNEARLKELLERITTLRIGVLGDLCIDVYWKADMRKSELSRETPHYPLPVVEEWFSPGAGGNLAANVLALKPKEAAVFGVLGDDWRAVLVRKELTERGGNLSHVVVDASRVTNGYCKPLRCGISDVVYEDPRLDFENHSPLPSATEARLIASLDAAEGLDALCVGDQFFYGCVTPAVRERVMRLACGGTRVIADSRYNIKEYRGVVLKPNEIEGCRAVYGEARSASFEEYCECARLLAKRNASDVVMTLGDKGCVFAGQSGAFYHVPAYAAEPPVDIVGAGDSMLAGLASGLAAGASWEEAMLLGNMCAGVTIKKLGTTGTASPREIMEFYTEKQARISDNG